MASRLLLVMLVCAVPAMARLATSSPGGATAAAAVAQQTQPPQAAEVQPQQAGGSCATYTEAAMRAGAGLLCTTQHLARTVTQIICQEFKPECTKTVTEYTLINPGAPGAPADAYAQSAVAACRVMGYSTFGAGSQHMVGAAKELCWNGKQWSRDNWWTNLVCCK